MATTYYCDICGRDKSSTSHISTYDLRDFYDYYYIWSSIKIACGICKEDIYKKIKAIIESKGGRDG